MIDEHPARRVTLQRHILESQQRHPDATGELSVLLTQVAYAGKIFAHALGRAPLSGRLGAIGGSNVQGEATKKLDLFGNETIVDAFATSELVAAIVSEEDDEPRQIACGPGAKYILCIDPLDGSSNSDINGVVGTMFGIYEPATDGGREADVTRVGSGRDQVAAGSIVYGPSTAFVYTTGEGLHGFTLDEDIGEFVLTHPAIRCPESGPYYSANLANVPTWPSSARRYMGHLTDPAQAAHPYSLRYAGALAADVHRTVLEGGIYLYPCDLEAIAYGVAAIGAIGAVGDDAFVTLNPGRSDGTGNAAVIAAGTGLGEAGLYWDGRVHRPFASEGGHASFAPRDDIEIGLLRFLLAEHGHVSWERVLSGPGLHNIYRFLRDVRRGDEPTWLADRIRDQDPAAVIAECALDHASPLCEQALQLFVSLYGAEAGNLALKTLATGGVFVAGGIAPKILAALIDGAFLQAFLGKGRLRPLLEAIPIRVVVNHTVALLGAARGAVSRA